MRKAPLREKNSCTKATWVINFWIHTSHSPSLKESTITMNMASLLGQNLTCTSIPVSRSGGGKPTHHEPSHRGPIAEQQRSSPINHAFKVQTGLTVMTEVIMERLTQTQLKPSETAPSMGANKPPSTSNPKTQHKYQSPYQPPLPPTQRKRKKTYQPYPYPSPCNPR